MSDTYLIIAIFLATLATFATRAIPFLFYAKKEPGEVIKYIELYMPMMIMVILVFYAVRDVDFIAYPYGAPELAGIFMAGFLHVKLKNALFSIIIATLFYMFLMQVVS